MKELSAILQSRGSAAGQTLALATLVNASGSTYRRPGARMLVLPNGQAIGSISGGCLERDVIEKAAGVIKTGQSALLTYDTTSEEDIVFGAGLGCKGAVHILVEPLLCGSPATALLDFIDTLFRRRQSGVAATVFRVGGGGQIGERLMLGPDSPVLGEIGDAALRAKTLDCARETFATNRSKSVAFELPDGAAEVFVEMIHSPVPLVIFGAGYDAVPLSRLGKELGFEVTIADVRPAYATRERFPEADAVVIVQPDDLTRLGLNDRTAVVVMSHNYLTDRAFLKGLLPLELRYLGVMGPRTRAQKMLHELHQEGLKTDEASVRKIHNPIGLDIGAENPEQIALAILAEIQAVVSGHAGGLLREKKGSIHAAL